MEQNKRASDRGFLPMAGQTVRAGSTHVWDWAEKRKIAAHAAMAVTLWLTIRVAEWTMDLPYDMASMYPEKYTGVDVAAMQAGVLGPFALMQAALLKFYLDLVRNAGNGGNEHAKT